MTLQPATTSAHYAVGVCSVCGEQTSYYINRGKDLPIYCPDCLRKRRTGTKKPSGGYSLYTLIHDPRGPVFDEWGSLAPKFCGEEIIACIPYSKYEADRDYPFAPGCQFVGERGALYGVYVKWDGYMIFGRVNK